MQSEYLPSIIEAKWQKIWQENATYEVKNDASNPYYVLEMFLYPSGKLHMGHLRNYSIGDVIARFKRSLGYDVLHPTGYDAFGLPAENAAIKNHSHPADWTFANIEHMRKQLKSVGLSYDYSREIITCTPQYYKHEQKIFTDFLKKDIAYRKEAEVNWDPVDETVLANEQVIEGRGWRSGALVQRKKLSQWFLRISDFSEELLDGLKNLKGWSERVKLMQENWIGKSIGAEVIFKLNYRGGFVKSASNGTNHKEIKIFTTRPETLFGASFIGIASEHPIALSLADNNPQIADFIAECKKSGNSLEAIETAEKKGIDTGIKAIHPFTGEELPVYIANFVLMDYGTGAVFACPAHDARDFEFASKYNLPIKQVIAPSKSEALDGATDGAKGSDTDGEANIEDAEELQQAYTGDGLLVNSDFLNGLSVSGAKNKAIARLESLKMGSATTSYRLRDWGVSRQRYWGCPIPIIYCDDCGAVPVPDEDLPVTLPQDIDFSSEIKGNPLVSHPSWKHTKCPNCQKDAIRETDTFDTFFESSWYFLRFLSPGNHQKAFSPADVAKWLPIDNYIGGIEHAVMHLLYARFFTLALDKCGYFAGYELPSKEPFKNLLTQGMVCHATYQDDAGNWLYPEEIAKSEGGKLIHKKTKKPVIKGRVEKMSKSKNNLIDPTNIIKEYGADTARLFMLSDSPVDKNMEWSNEGVQGAYRYLKRVWKLSCNLGDDARDTEGGDDEILKMQHKTIKAVKEDLENYQMNTAIAKIREFTNFLEKYHNKSCIAYRNAVKTAICLLNPFVPHITEEIWHHLKDEGEGLICEQSFPEYDDIFTKTDEVTIAIQVNGKVRGKVILAKDATEEEARKIAIMNVSKFIEGKNIRKFIYVKGKIISIVAN